MDFSKKKVFKGLFSTRIISALFLVEDGGLREHMVVNVGIPLFTIVVTMDLSIYVERVPINS